MRSPARPLEGLQAAPATAPFRAPAAATLRPLGVADLDAVTDIENRAYSHPWTRGNFTDSLASGYLAQGLWRSEPDPARRSAQAAAHCLGYYVAMPGVDEMHLLNITVRPEEQGRGWARMMLAHLAQASRAAGAGLLWLEVRQSNDRARRLYEDWGFLSVGVRKAYYPASQGQREDAIVMRLRLATVTGA